MRSFPRSSSIPPAREPEGAPVHMPAWDLPGVREIRATPPEQANLGLGWAAVVFCTFGAPPALVLAGLVAGGEAPVGFWVAACGFFFLGLGLSLTLRPLPPRRVFRPRGSLTKGGARKAMAARRAASAERFQFGAELREEFPTLSADLSRVELLEQLAKLREQGDLSNAEFRAALKGLLGE